MNKDMNTYLNEAVEEGIITNKQRLELKLKLGRDKIDNGRRMSRIADLVLSLIFVIIVLSSAIMIIYNNPNSNAFISIFISLIFIIGSIFICFDAVRKNNYFLKEIAVMTNALSNVMLATSIGLIMSYNYYFPDNVYIGFLVTLPLLFVIDTYISKFIVIFGFCIIRTPYLNLSFFPLYNTTVISIITLMLMIGTIYKISVFLANNNNNNCDEGRFLSFKARITIQEILLYILLMKMNRIFFGNHNIFIIYSIYIILLIRRTSIFKQAVQLPIIFDSLFFIYTVFFFARFDVDVKNDMNILVCHTIYYAIYFTLLKNNKLSNVDRFYKIQQQFYINIFLLTYILFNLENVDTHKYIFILSVITGIFNVYQGKVEMRLGYVILGLTIVILAIMITGSVTYGIATIVLVIFTLSFMINKMWDKVKNEVSRNNEK